MKNYKNCKCVVNVYNLLNSHLGFPDDHNIINNECDNKEHFCICYAGENFVSYCKSKKHVCSCYTHNQCHVVQEACKSEIHSCICKCNGLEKCRADHNEKYCYNKNKDMHYEYKKRQIMYIKYCYYDSEIKQVKYKTYYFDGDGGELCALFFVDSLCEKKSDSDDDCGYLNFV